MTAKKLPGQLTSYEKDGKWGWAWTPQGRGAASLGAAVYDTKAKALAAGRKHARKRGV